LHQPALQGGPGCQPSAMGNQIETVGYTCPSLCGPVQGGSVQAIWGIARFEKRRSATSPVKGLVRRKDDWKRLWRGVGASMLVCDALKRLQRLKSHSRGRFQRNRSAHPRFAADAGERSGRAIGSQRTRLQCPRAVSNQCNHSGFSFVLVLLSCR
jgi:hypothetical protein